MINTSSNVKMPMLPSVSVIIPVRDDNGGLDLCLRALEVQSYQGVYEVVVVDNDSLVSP